MITVVGNRLISRDRLEECSGAELLAVHTAIPKNRELKKKKEKKFRFFRQRHALLTSFNIFVVTSRVTNFFAKTLVNMLLFSTEKNN